MVGDAGLLQETGTAGKGKQVRMSSYGGQCTKHLHLGEREQGLIHKGRCLHTKTLHVKEWRNHTKSGKVVFSTIISTFRFRAIFVSVVHV